MSSESTGRPNVAVALTVSVENHVAMVTLDRPPVNALSDATIAELDTVFTALEAHEQVRVVVLTGGPRIFSAGVDIRELRAEPTDNTIPRNRRYQRIYQSIADCTYPVIAAINGYALGGGCELAMACDIRVASRDAFLGLPEINLGGIPGIGGMQRLQRLVGPSKAKQFVLTGDRVQAVEAHRIGLLDELAPDGQAIDAARNLATRMASRPPLSVQAGKKALNLGRELSLADALEVDLRMCGEVAGTRDRAECLAAFLEKREPRITGR